MSVNKRTHLPPHIKMQQFLKQIEKAKNDMKNFQDKRLKRINSLISKYRLEFIDEAILDREFKQLAERLHHESQ
ncbi:MAG: hypothetical protein K5Q00_07400 [Gammaproteobacteria bacterium]|nr:hypothetical protein [Gammaproteobacteria bacterium]